MSHSLDVLLHSSASDKTLSRCNVVEDGTVERKRNVKHSVSVLTLCIRTREGNSISSYTVGALIVMQAHSKSAKRNFDLTRGR